MEATERTKTISDEQSVCPSSIFVNQREPVETNLPVIAVRHLPISSYLLYMESLEKEQRDSYYFTFPPIFIHRIHRPLGNFFPSHLRTPLHSLSLSLSLHHLGDAVGLSPSFIPSQPFRYERSRTSSGAFWPPERSLPQYIQPRHGPQSSKSHQQEYDLPFSMPLCIFGLDYKLTALPRSLRRHQTCPLQILPSGCLSGWPRLSISALD